MKNTQIVDELIEEIGNNQEIVKSFEVRDSLSSDIFEKKDGEFFMHKEIRDKLLEVVESFMEFIDIEFFIHDIILTGSLSNYNWSKYSDVDLHIMVDFDELDGSNKTDSIAIHDIMKNFFDTKRSLWNKQHKITIKGYDCEVYVQDVDEKHLATGIYSVLNNKWIITPEKTTQSIDKDLIISKAERFQNLIDKIDSKFEDGDDVDWEIKSVKQSLKKFRQCGLDKGGEFSYENLAFKLLRRNGYIEKLLDIQTRSKDKKLSITQQ
jgi:CxxC motif-containing protein